MKRRLFIVAPCWLFFFLLLQNEEQKQAIAKEKTSQQAVFAFSFIEGVLFAVAPCSLFFFLLLQKEAKKSPEMDYIAISGWIPDGAFVLL